MILRHGALGAWNTRRSDVARHEGKSVAQRDPGEIRAILEHNVGFADPAAWVDYAASHGFRRVAATRVPRCPDCSGAAGRFWGQYVYYSTLIRLRQCNECGLIWADAHIDPEVVRRHFDHTYKGDEYFRKSRDAIFEHLASTIQRLAPRGARILDIGGARGDLMHKVVTGRPDVSATVHDLSAVATDWAATHFGLRTLTGDADALASHPEQYDVVVLSDVLYYEPKLRVLFDALSHLIRPGGALVARLPNHLPMIRLGKLWGRVSQSDSRRRRQDHVAFFNPEHIFAFPTSYLHARFRSIGFSEVRTMPSPLLQGSVPRAATALLFRLAAGVNRMTGRRLVLTPAMLVVGTHRGTGA